MTDDSLHLDDLTKLSDMTEDSLVEVLGQRFLNQIIYTYAGTILVALNPFKKLPLYTPEIMKRYTLHWSTEKPHVYGIAEAAMSAFRSMRRNQAIIISGESGAGKTETTKLILEYYTTMAHNSENSTLNLISQQIMETNFILESFGNSKTDRNSNSSRFGKFLQVLMDDRNRIIGASIRSFLLERSRVVKFGKNERCFHVFYELIRGASPDQRVKYRLLRDVQDYNYLNTGALEVPGQDDGRNYELLRRALVVLQMNPDDVDTIFSILSAILLLGNVSWLTAPEGDKLTFASARAVDLIKSACALLECDGELLKKSLLERTITVGTEKMVSPLTREQAMEKRDVVAKILFEKIFTYIFSFINGKMAPQTETEGFIGILDMYGFEHFERNGFEQLCINYANERLQQFFNSIVFKSEQEEYKKEAIPWQHVPFKDNVGCLALIENGVVLLLDEECKLPKGTEFLFLSKLDTQFQAHESYICSKIRNGTFGIRHFAGNVSYTIDGFLEKNRDSEPVEIVELLKNSENTFVAKLFEGSVSSSKAHAKKISTTIMTFKSSLNSLVSLLNTTSARYITCVKTNPIKKPLTFDDEHVHMQLHAAGLLEAVKIRKAGYSIRVPFGEFNEKFRWLAGEEADPKQRAKMIIQKAMIPDTLLCIGKTKVFLHQKAFDTLMKRTEDILVQKVVKIQRFFRSKRRRTQNKARKRAALILQKYIRRRIARQRFVKLRNAVILVQSFVRRWYARDYFRSLLKEKRLQDEVRIKRERVKQEEEREKERIALLERTRAKEIELERLRDELDAEAGLGKKKSFNGQPPPASQNVPKGPARRISYSRDDPESEAKPVLQKTLKPERLSSTAEVMNAGRKLAVDRVEEEPPTMTRVERVASVVASSTSRGQRQSVEPKDAGVPTKAWGERLSSSGGSSESQKLQRNSQPSDSTKSLRRLSVATPSLPTSSRNEDNEGIVKEEKENVVPKLEPLPSKNGPTVFQPVGSKLDVNVKQPKSNPLANKIKEQEEVPDNRDYFQLYVERWFEKHVDQNGKPVPASDMLCFTTEMIPTSMTIMRAEPREMFVQMAQDSFSTILAIISPERPVPEETQAAQYKLLSLGCEFEEIRDEILVQLCRQVTPSETSKQADFWPKVEEHGWEMLKLATCCFPPSKAFRRGFNHFLNKNLQACAGKDGRKPIADTIKFTMDAVKRLVLNGARTVPPSPQEMSAIEKNIGFQHTFYYHNNKSDVVDVLPGLTCADVVHILAERVGIQNSAGWSLSAVRSNPYSSQAMQGTIYFADALAQTAPFPEPPQMGANGDPNFANPNAPNQNIQQPRIYLGKRLFRDFTAEMADPVEFELLYQQSVAELLSDTYPLDDNQALQLGAIVAQAELGDCNPSNLNKFGSTLDKFLPTWLLMNAESLALVNAIQPLYQDMQGQTVEQARKLFLNTLRLMSFYGRRFIPAQFVGFWPYPLSIVLSVWSEGISFMHEKTILETVRFSRISHWVLDGPETITLHIQRDGVDDTATDAYTFRCAAQNLSNLMKDYVDRVACERRAGMENILSELDIKPIAREQERTRAVLISEKVLNIPAGLNTASITYPLTESFTGSRDIFKAEENELDWNQLMSRLQPPFLVNCNGKEQLIAAATKVNAIFDGVTRPATIYFVETTRSPKLFAVVKEVVQYCQETAGLADEVLFQIMRLTGENANHEPTAISVLWEIFAILATCLKPENGRITDAVKSHLRRSTVINEKVAPQIPQLAEVAKYAKYAEKGFDKAIVTAARRFPPTDYEMDSIVGFQPMNIRITLADGQFRTVPFAPYATVQDVLSILPHTLLARLYLQETYGFALFGVLQSSVRALSPSEKMCDVLASWQAMDPEEAAWQNPHIEFRRRLYKAGTGIPIPEFEMVLMAKEIFGEMREHRIPLSEGDIVKFVALNALVEFGNSVHPMYIPFEQLLQDLIPEYLRLSPNVLDNIVEEYSGYCATAYSAVSGYRMILEELSKWTFFGSKVYDVSQNVSQEIPYSCWLLVNWNGLHLAARNEKSVLRTILYTQIKTVNLGMSVVQVVLKDDTDIYLSTNEGENIRSLIDDYRGAVHLTPLPEPIPIVGADIIPIPPSPVDGTLGAGFDYNGGMMMGGPFNGAPGEFLGAPPSLNQMGDASGMPIDNTQAQYMLNNNQQYTGQVEVNQEWNGNK